MTSGALETLLEIDLALFERGPHGCLVLVRLEEHDDPGQQRAGHRDYHQDADESPEEDPS